MIKPILAFATLVIVSTFSNGFSQDDKVVTSKEFVFELSNPYPVVNAEVKRYFASDGGIVSVKMNRDGIIVQKFTANTLNQENYELFNDLEANAVYEGDLLTQDYIYFFYSAWDRANETEQLFVRKISLSTGEMEGNSERLISIKGKITGGDGNKFQVEESFDHSKLMIRYRKTPEKRNDKISKDVIGIYIFNRNDLSKIWGDDIEMPYTEARMNNLEYAVDKNGNAFILTEVMKEGETRRFDKEDNPNFDIQLIAVEENGRNVLATDMNTQGKFVNQVGFFEGRDNTLLLAGYYSNQRGFQVDGIFLLDMNAQGEQLDLKTYEVPSEIVKQYISEREKKKIDKSENKGYDISLRDMVLRELLIQDDGSLLFSGERYYCERHFNPQTKESTYSHHYKDILIAKISTNGELEYMHKLPKNQVGTTYTSEYRGDLGYKLISSEKYFYFVFMDNVKNMTLDSNKIPIQHKSTLGGFLTAYQVEKSSGQLAKLSILDTRDAKGTELFQFNTERIVEISENQIAVEFYKKKKEDVMIKITIQD